MRVQIITTERNAQLMTILTGVMIATGNHLDVTHTEKIPENVRTLRTGISLGNVQVTGTVLEGVSRVHTTPAGTGPDNTERKIPQDHDTGADETRLPDVTTMRKESVWEEAKSVEVVEVSHAQIEKNAQLLTLGVVTVQSSITSGLFAQYLKHKLITTIEKHLQVDKTLILKDRDSCLSPKRIGNTLLNIN